MRHRPATHPVTGLTAAASAVTALVLAAGAQGQTPVLHETTVQIPGASCSVTAWDYFDSVRGDYAMHYGGGTSCAGNTGQRTLNVVPQVFNLVHGQPLWFNIGGDGLFQGPTPASPLRLSRVRTAVAGHIYRLLVYGQVTSNGRTSSVTACTGCQGTRPALSIKPPSGFIYSWPATSVSMPGVACSVTQAGASFPYINGTPVMYYGGHLSCASNVTGRRTLTIAAQVAGPGPEHVYYTINGSTLSTSSSASPFLSLNTARSVYIGHPYRVIAIGTVTTRGRTITTSAHSLTAGP